MKSLFVLRSLFVVLRSFPSSAWERQPRSSASLLTSCTLAALLILAPSQGSLAESPWDGLVDRTADVEISQVQFLAADAAELIDAGEDGVIVLVEGLQADKQYGAVLRTRAEIEWIEVHNAERPFPPKMYEPIDTGKFLLRGERGQQYYVSLRGAGIPTWIEVTIAGEPSGPDPPDPDEPDPDQPDLEKLTELSRRLSRDLGDAATAAVLRSAIRDTVTEINGECQAGECPAVSEAKRRVVAAIEAALLSRGRPDVDWLNGWRKPISDVLDQLDTSTTSKYLAAISAAADGLE